jgi:hypothetical protein
VADEERVRETDRQQHEVARTGDQSPLRAPELGGPGQDEEHLVFFEVPVQRRGEPGRVEELRDRRAATGLRLARLDRREVAEEPQRLPLEERSSTARRWSAAS